MVEKIFFNVIAFTLFILMFFKLVKKNDTNYVYLLIAQFIGIALSFFELVTGIKLNIAFKLLMYVLSIIIPIVVLFIEYKKNISFSEMLIVCLMPLLKVLNKKETIQKYLETSIEKNPESVTLHKLLAGIYEDLKKEELAIEEYEKIISLENYEQDIYIKLGKLYGKNNRQDEAKEIFANILRKQPDCYEASMEFADILYNEESYKEAIQIYNAALRYRPADYELYYDLGMAYTMLNDFQKAKENYEKAAQINSDLHKAKYTLGQLALIYGDLDEAKNFLEECINDEEVEAGAYFYLARISIIKGELDKAINYINIAVEEDTEVYEKVQNDNIFVTIKDKIKKPDIENAKEANKTKREIDVEKHLYSTCKLVGKLNNNDLQMIENVMKTREINEEQKEKDI